MAGGYSSPRSVGYSLGSAIGGLVLAAGSDTGHVFPNDSAYTTAALVGIVMMAITTMASLVLARKRSPEAEPTVAPAAREPEPDEPMTRSPEDAGTRKTEGTIRVEPASSWVLTDLDPAVRHRGAIRAGGGFTAQEQQRRERVRLEAAERFERGDGNRVIAADLRVTVRPVGRWRQSWRQGGSALEWARS